MNGLFKRVVFALLAVLILVIFGTIPTPDGLGRDGMLAIGLTFFNITLWLGNVVPKPIAGLMVLILLPFLGVTESANKAFQNFISPVFFFLLAAFAIAAMVRNCELPQRLMLVLLKFFHNSTKKIVLAYMVASAIISTVMSDLAACALFAAVVLSVFDDPDLGLKFDKQFMKCIMIGVPIGSLCGGIATPIGSSSNITMLELLTQTSGMEVSFLQWMVVGVPVAIISVFLSWIALCIAFKPAPLTAEEVQALKLSCGNLGRISVREIKTIVLISVMFVFWILSGYIKFLDSTIVAIIGMVIMFIPGVDLLKWDDYQKEVPWDLVIMLGTLMSLAASLLSTGAIDWVATSALAGSSDWNPYVLLFAISAIIAFMRAFVPSGPPIVVMLTPALVALAQAANLNPLCVILAMSIWAQITFLIPAIDALYLITYQTGYYTIGDVLKFGIPLTLILLVIFTLLLPPLVTLAQMI